MSHYYMQYESLTATVNDSRILNFLDIVLQAIAIHKNVTNFTERKNGGCFERQAAIGWRNMPHHSYIAVHTRK